MRRFMVHLVTEIDFVDGGEASDAAAQKLPEASLGDCPERGPGDLASDNQERPGRKRLGHRS